MTFEKKIIENTTQFSNVWGISTFFIQVNLLAFCGFFRKKWNYPFPERSVSNLLKYDFLVDLKSL